MHEGTYSRLSRPRIKMRYPTPWLTILLLSVISAASTENIQSPSLEDSQQAATTENAQSPSSKSNDKIVFANNNVPKKLRQNDDNDIAPESIVTVGDILFFESFINGDKIIEENKRNSVPSKKNDKLNIIVSDSENPIESKISTDVIDIRRQGELRSKLKPGKSSSEIQYDNSKEEVESELPPRFGQRKRKQNVREETPVLQLTQGGYNRPFRQPRFRNRYMSRPDSSEQSSQAEEPSQNSNRQPEARQVVPQVIYTSSPQQPQDNGPRQLLNPGIQAPRNMLAVHHIQPATIQSPFFNAPPTGIADYTAVPFQNQLPRGNEVNGFPNLIRDPNNAALYQASQMNPFQAQSALFQTTPEIQTQPIEMDPARNVPLQFQQNPFTPFPAFENSEDNSRDNYAMFFRDPSVSNQFQIPSNFYSTPPSGVNAFNSPPINFLSNYPNSGETLPSGFFQYPATTTEGQNREGNSNDQQSDSDTSQEDKKSKLENQESLNPANRNEPSSVPFGNRLQLQNGANVYMRYPTNEAGYATEENLPSQSNSSEIRDNSQETNSGQGNFLATDPFRNGLSLLPIDQRINNSFDIPREIFRGVPVDFGYQRPQIFLDYRERNQGVPNNYQGPNFQSRGPFGALVNLPENNYQLLAPDNQRRGHRDSDLTPSCAKENNASVCFEDNEYPRNDIVYSLNSNSFLADRLAGQEMPLESVTFVESNDSDTDQGSENYACATDTKYGAPLRAKNLAGTWRVIVNIQGRFLQPVRMEVCKSFGSPCSHVDSRIKTTCVQKYSLQRLLSWSLDRGIYSDVYKVPVACSCQILKSVEL